MSDAMHYIHLQPLAWDVATLTDEARAAGTKTWMCRACLHPRPGIGRVDARIKNRTIHQGPLNFTDGLPLARLSFLLRLGEERVKRDLHLGDVYGPDGSRLDDWVTFRGKRGLIVRGTTHAGNRVCSECGRNLYFAMHPRYLYPQPPSDCEIFESDLFGLIFPDRVGAAAGIGCEIRRVRGAEVLDWPGLVDSRGTDRYILVERLKVLPHPLDGLPALSF